MSPAGDICRVYWPGQRGHTEDSSSLTSSRQAAFMTVTTYLEGPTKASRRPSPLTARALGVGWASRHTTLAAGSVGAQGQLGGTQTYPQLWERTPVGTTYRWTSWGSSWTTASCQRDHHWLKLLPSGHKREHTCSADPTSTQYPGRSPPPAAGLAQTLTDLSCWGALSSKTTLTWELQAVGQPRPTGTGQGRGQEAGRGSVGASPATRKMRHGALTHWYWAKVPEEQELNRRLPSGLVARPVTGPR